MSDIIPAIIGGCFALAGIVLKDALQRRRIATWRARKAEAAALGAPGPEPVSILSVIQASRPRTQKYFRFAAMALSASMTVFLLFIALDPDETLSEVTFFLIGAGVLLTGLFGLLGALSFLLRRFKRS